MSTTAEATVLKLVGKRVIFRDCGTVDLPAPIPEFPHLLEGFSGVVLRVDNDRPVLYYSIIIDAEQSTPTKTLCVKLFMQHHNLVQKIYIGYVVEAPAQGQPNSRFGLVHASPLRKT